MKLYFDENIFLVKEKDTEAYEGSLNYNELFVYVNLDWYSSYITRGSVYPSYACLLPNGIKTMDIAITDSVDNYTINNVTYVGWKITMLDRCFSMPGIVQVTIAFHLNEYIPGTTITRAKRVLKTGVSNLVVHDAITSAETIIYATTDEDNQAIMQDIQEVIEGYATSLSEKANLHGNSAVDFYVRNLYSTYPNCSIGTSTDYFKNLFVKNIYSDTSYINADVSCNELATDVIKAKTSNSDVNVRSSLDLLYSSTKSSIKNVNDIDSEIYYLKDNDTTYLTTLVDSNGNISITPLENHDIVVNGQLRANGIYQTSGVNGNIGTTSNKWYGGAFNTLYADNLQAGALLDVNGSHRMAFWTNPNNPNEKINVMYSDLQPSSNGGSNVGNENYRFNKGCFVSVYGTNGYFTILKKNDKEVATEEFVNTSVARDSLVSTIGNASNLLSGLMSATDKARLDTLVALLGSESGDSDTVVNTIREVLAIFESYPEGSNLVTQLSTKANANEVYAKTETYTRSEVNALIPSALSSEDMSEILGVFN